MRKSLCLILVFILALLLCACNSAQPKSNDPDKANSNPAQTVATETTGNASEAATTGTAIETTPIESTQAETTPEPTAPAHSPLYLADYTPEQIWEYFEEVVLHMEYTDGTGNPALVQKWLTPLCYRISGSPTDEDLAILEDFFAQLNNVPGVPGIHPAAEGELHNLDIRFLDHQTFRLAFSATLNGEDAYGAAQFWYYTATNELHTANIGYRTDMDQETRASILIEEIINTLGITDTVLRTDSIVYQYSDENLTLSDVDWVILKLLYNPAIQCGMNAEQCRAIVQQLYY